jgi:hypothetical protein
VKVPTWVLVHPGPSTAIREEWFPVIVQREECNHRDKRTTAHFDHASKFIQSSCSIAINHFPFYLAVKCETQTLA